jgi:hypothetical protein
MATVVFGMSESDPEPELEAEPGVDEGHQTDDSGLDVPDPELGQATIVYDDPDGEKTSREVDNEHIVYFQDH